MSYETQTVILSDQLVLWTPSQALVCFLKKFRKISPASIIWANSDKYCYLPYLEKSLAMCNGNVKDSLCSRLKPLLYP